MIAPALTRAPRLPPVAMERASKVTGMGLPSKSPHQIPGDAANQVNTCRDLRRAAYL
jgi:hypothetical protein